MYYFAATQRWQQKWYRKCEQNQSEASTNFINSRRTVSIKICKNLHKCRKYFSWQRTEGHYFLLLIKAKLKFWMLRLRFRFFHWAVTQRLKSHARSFPKNLDIVILFINYTSNHSVWGVSKLLSSRPRSKYSWIMKMECKVVLTNSPTLPRKN